MRKILNTFLVLGLLVFASEAFAQAKIVSGTVTGDDGLPVAGATVRAVGTQAATITGVDGDFSFSVPEGADELRVSFIGLESKTIDIIGQEMSINLSTDAALLDEVVVTATGTRNKDRLNYDVQSVSADQVNQTPVTDVSEALAGKVSGLQVFGNSAVTFDDAGTRLRGVNGGIGGGSPIYVIDGVIVPNQNSVDPNTIESINVLKGANATALYGVRASNGAIVITTKRGQGEGTFSFTSSTSISSVSTFFDYQKEYGGGYSQDFNEFSYNPAIHPTEWAAFDGQSLPEYYADESWGPRLEGQMVRHWDSWIPGGENFGQLRPWSPGDTPLDFFDTAPTFDNGLTFNKGGDGFSILGSFRNNTKEGLIPNSGQLRNYATLNTTFDIKDNLTFKASGRYNTVKTSNDPAGGYSNLGSNLSQWWQMNLDFNRLESLYLNPDGSTNSWNINGPTDPTPLYWNNPYFDALQSDSESASNRIIGSFSLDFEPIEDLVITPAVNLYHNEFNADGFTPSGGLNPDSYSQNTSKSDEITYQLKGSYFKKISDKFNFEVTGVGELYNLKGSSFAQSTSGGLTIPGFYAITGETDANVSQSAPQKKVESLYGFVNLGLFNDILFLEGAVRSDWTSTIALDQNPVVTPSGGFSFIFSDLINNDALSFGKIRYSYADRLQDIGIFQTSQGFDIGTAYGSQATLFVPSTLTNPNLRGATIPSHEVGMSLGFFNDRLTLDGSYFNYKNKDFAVDLDVPGTSGFNSVVVNAGEIETNGWELAVTGIPIQTDDWKLSVFGNVGNSSSVVNELGAGLDNYRFASFAFRGTPSLDVNARVGEDWGSIYGRSRTFDEQGRPIISSSGSWVTENVAKLGNALPKLTGGLTTNLEWKNFSLFATSDFRVGGQFFSISKMFNSYSGLGTNTIGNNALGNPVRDPVRNSAGDIVTVVNANDAASDTGGVYMEGVDATTGEPVGYYREAQSYYSGYGTSFWVNDLWTYDADYIKMRDIRLNYNLPASLFANSNSVSSAAVGFYANNVGLLWSKAKDLDPSEIENYNSGGFNIRWLDGGQFPSARSMGVNLRVNF